MIEKIIDRVKCGKYNFKNEEEKLLVLDNAFDAGISIEEQIKIIKSLSKKRKEEVLSRIFNYSTIHDIEDKDLDILFSSLIASDKMKAITLTNSTYNRRVLIRKLSQIDYINILINKELTDKDRSYIITLLDKNSISVLSHLLGALYYSEEAKMYMHLSDFKIRKRLKTVNSLRTYHKNELISYLSSDEEKLELFKVPNKFKLELSKRDKLEIIPSFTDENKFKILNNELDLGFSLDKYERRSLVLSLSDEGKIKYLEAISEYDDFDKYDYSKIFSCFSSDTSKYILENLDKHTFDINSDGLIELIKRLDIEDRIMFLYPTNPYNIDLSNERKIVIINSLPIQYRKRILYSLDKYELDLDEEEKGNIIKKMDTLNIINILVFDNENKYNFSKENIWKIIESLNEEDAVSLLSTTNKEVREFIETYKVSFVKCLSNKDKIDVLLNRSKYGIWLEDNRKIKILRTISQYSTIEMEENVFKYFEDVEKALLFYIKDKKEFFKLNEVFQKQVVSYYMNKNINDEEIELGLSILKFTDNPEEILTRYDLFKNFLHTMDIDLYDFLQFGINSSTYNWCENILNIINTGTVNEFYKVKNYFFEYYYDNKSNKKNSIQNFLEILDSYSLYREFCVNLTNEKISLTKKDKDNIRFLFNNKSSKEVLTLEDVDNIRKDIITSYNDIASNSHNIYRIKDSIFEILFGKDTYKIEHILNYTGRTEDLKILEFNNRDKTYLKNMFECVILITSFIEEIIYSDDIDGLRILLLDLTDVNNVEHTNKLNSFFSKYEEYVRVLFELDLKSSLTKVSTLDKSYSKTSKAREMALKYGGKVIDLSESKYVLSAHVMSRRETIDEIINGECDGKSNYICMSPVSHRGQHYYYGSINNKVVFAYDTILEDSFICSSTSNMGSNMSLKYNSVEVPEISRNQRGVLETSEAYTGNNAEILLYRGGLKPCGIIVPSGTKPSEDAIKYHKEYNLPFIITQKLDSRIDNPKEISSLIEGEVISKKEHVDELKVLLEQLKSARVMNKRRIAVITDIHSLYEPTLACLTDISKRGITEIYSLGDNIGHGPSPKEVLEILDEYNVKSVYGNHELYLIEEDGIKEFLEHFPSKESIHRTEHMNEWMKSILSKEQIEKIKSYPERYEIELSNGKKITLIHTDDKYNVVGKYSYIPEFTDTELILKGHAHFKSSMEGDNITLRAVGIGSTQDDDGLATYYIIDIEDDKYEVTPVNIKYDRTNLQHTINESDMPTLAKSLISNWVG